MATIIRVDYENSAEDWWNAAQTDTSAPWAVAPMLADNADELLVADDEATAVRAWAESLPGWDTGPEYAPTALRFERLPDEADDDLGAAFPEHAFRPH